VKVERKKKEKETYLLKREGGTVEREKETSYKKRM
jgi:hypothetical protein